MSRSPIVYLSPAVPARKRLCPDGTDAGELIARYLDELCRSLTACGVAWQRNGTDLAGAAGVRRAVSESNACGAALHYVVRTADGAGTGESVLLAAPEQLESARALARSRAELCTRKVRIHPCRDMYEMVYANAPCLYEYIAAHENAADMRWLHHHTAQLAAATARVFCDIFRKNAHRIGA